MNSSPESFASDSTTPSDGASPTDGGSSSDKPAGLVLDRIPGTFGICRLSPSARIPRWVHRSIFYTISRSPNELSILCEERVIPAKVKCDPGWSAIKIAGTLDLSLIGVLASLAGPLAEARIGLFTVSTYDTDYLLVREKRLADATVVLEKAGHTFDLRLLETPEAIAADPEPEASPVTESAAPEPAAAEVTEQKTDQDTFPQETAAPSSLSDRSSLSAPSSLAARSSFSAPASADQQACDSPSAIEADPVVADPVVADPVAADPVEASDEAEKPARHTQGGAFGRVLGERREPSPLGRPAPKPRHTWQPAQASEVSEPEAAAPKPRHTWQPAQASEVSEPEVAAPKPRHSWQPTQASPVSEPEVAELQPVGASPVAERELPEVNGEVPKEFSVEPKAKPAAATDGSEAEGLFTGAIPQHPVELTDLSFADLGLSPAILETVREVGFENPTPIQVQVIPLALEGHDVVGLAETGSGKTAAFSLPMAERLTHGRGTRGLILCPTREIALQTKAFLDIFGRDHQLETVAVIGGVRMGPQIDGFRRDADILVATPGRLADHMRRRNVRLDKIEKLVLDEADHMLDLGFLPQIKEILEQVPDGRQTLMFSATMPPPIERLAQIFMRDPKRCDIRPSGQIAAGIEHRLYLVKDEDRKNCLFALLREVKGSTLIFVRRKLYTEWLARQIELAGFRVARIHSDRTQSQRVEALKSFREGKVRILVATDVAARGIDVPLIQHVINYGLPEQTEDYVHRAGRTARGSSVGIVSTIGTWQDKLTVREIELDLDLTMPRCAVEGVDAYVELPKRKVVRRRRLL